MPEAAAAQRLRRAPQDRRERYPRNRDLRAAAERFCVAMPYRQEPYRKRNWGGQLHSLCSYQGKLKPAIAHFLVREFTSEGDTVLDPMAGVGTIPLEARLQRREAVAGDLSELAAVVSRAKLERFDLDGVEQTMCELAKLLADDRTPLRSLVQTEDAGFGLNGAIEDYFGAETLREVLLARRFFAPRIANIAGSEAVVLTALLHILHGNRPYAISRRSHPLTPLKPSGPSHYRPLIDHLWARIRRVEPAFERMDCDGRAFLADFDDVPLASSSVDAVITSPPFVRSLRFFSANWMRLWMCGWSPSDFRTRPTEFLEQRQIEDFDASYRGFFAAMGRVLRPGGLLIMHLGESARFDMTTCMAGLVEAPFRTVYVGRECVADTESHGLTDKGATIVHSFLFCRRD